MFIARFILFAREFLLVVLFYFDSTKIVIMFNVRNILTIFYKTLTFPKNDNNVEIIAHLWLFCLLS